MSTASATILGMLFGALLGMGVYVYLVQAGGFDPISRTGLAFPIAGLLLGAAAGVFGGRRRQSRM